MTLNTAPIFDTARQGSGQTIIDITGNYDSGRSLAVQADGKILVAGHSTNNSHQSDFSLIRLNADGTLDTSFSGDGKAIFDIGESNDYSYSLTVQADGKILVAGYSTNSDYNNPSDFSLIRLNADGTLDTSFSGDGKAIFDISGGYDFQNNLAVQADGKILVVGSSTKGMDGSSSDFNFDFSVIRLNNDGTLDTSFSGDGKATFDIGGWGDYGWGLTLQSDGKILVAGSSNISSDSNYDNYSLIRLNADGTLDTTFSGDGKAIIDVTGNSDSGRSLTVQADGKILVAGTSGISRDYWDFSMIRLNADGTLDTSFSGDGKAIFDISGGPDYQKSLAVQADGKILIGGHSPNDTGTASSFSVIRLNTDGTLDMTFSGDGKATFDFRGGVYGVSMSVQADGKIVIAGTSYNDSADFDVIRLNANGTLDNTFGSQSSSLGGTIGYITGASAIALDTSVVVYDAELAALNGGLGNYAGASVTFSGHSPHDVLSGLGNLSLSSGSAILSGITVGTVSNTDGKLVITFNANATQARVNQTLSSIGYANSSSTPSTQGQIDWLFNDGDSTSALTVAGSTTVNIGVTQRGTDNIEVLSGDAGDDTLIGLGGNDVLQGLAGNDTLNGGAGADSMTGGNGSDRYYMDNTGDVVIETNATSTGGTDLVFSSLSAYTLGANVENGRILSSGTASLTGNALANLLYAGAGSNVLDGGLGTDTVSYLYATAGVTLSLASTTAQATGGSGSDTLKNVENLTGSNYADKLTGNAGSNILNGGTGADSLTGGDGSDTYYVDNAGDVVIETNTTITGGTDLVYSYLGTYTLGANVENGRINTTGTASLSGNALGNLLYAGAGSNILDGAAGTDTVSYLYATAGVKASLATTAAQATGGSGSDTLKNIENLTGSNYADTLTGNAGSNVLNGGAGADTLTGGDGSDTYYVDNVGDVVIETNAVASTGGTDLVFSALSAYTLGANVENGRINTTASANLTGNSLSNTLYAAAGNNVLDGGLGTDTASYLYATAGVTVSLASTVAQAIGGSGSDTLLSIESLTGSNYADTLTGSTGNNTLNGGTGNDMLNGGAGNDVLTGGLGADQLTGGTGADRFDFNLLTELGLTSTTWDTITDFKTSEGDKIDLLGVDANTALTGDQAFTFLGAVSTFTGDSTGQLRFDTTTHILYGSTDADTAAEFAIFLAGVNSLASTDLVL